MSAKSTRWLGLLTFGAAFAILFASVALNEGVGHADVPPGAVAVIEGLSGDAATITKEEFRRGLKQMAYETGLPRVPKSGEELTSLRRQTLSVLLDQTWLPEHAREMGVEVTDREVERELQKLKASRFGSVAAYRKFLSVSSYTPADFADRLRGQLLSGKVSEQLETATPKPGDFSHDELMAYYEEVKKDQLAEPEKRTVRLILNPKKGAIESALTQLTEDGSPAAWERLAWRNPADRSTRGNGGLRREIAEGSLEGSLDAAIFDAPEGRLEGPIKTPQGFYAFQVLAVAPEHTRPLSDAREEIEASLSTMARQDTAASFIRGYLLKWRARTVCATRYATERCANFPRSSHPYNAPPGCREKNPPDGKPASCPASVSQLVPALPGTVSIATPKGIALPQRPRPGSETEGEIKPAR